jgi:hypothetical protein
MHMKTPTRCLAGNEAADAAAHGTTGPLASTSYTSCAADAVQIYSKQVIKELQASRTAPAPQGYSSKWAAGQRAADAASSYAEAASKNLTSWTSLVRLHTDQGSPCTATAAGHPYRLSLFRHCSRARCTACNQQSSKKAALFKIVYRKNACLAAATVASAPALTFGACDAILQHVHGWPAS